MTSTTRPGVRLLHGRGRNERSRHGSHRPRIHTLALILFGLGALLWLVLGYGIPFTAVLGSRTRPVAKGANGTWFVWVVGAQSVAVVASSLAIEIPRSSLARSRPCRVPGADGSGHVGGGHRPLRRLRGGRRHAGAAPSVRAHGPRRSVLGDDGRPGDLDCRGVPDPRDRIDSDARCHQAADRRLLSAPLGLRHLAHPRLRARRRVASLRPSVPDELFSGTVEHGLPAGHVRGGEHVSGPFDQVPAIEWIGQHWFWVGFVVWAIIFAAMLCRSSGFSAGGERGPVCDFTRARRDDPRRPRAGRDRARDSHLGDGADHTASDATPSRQQNAPPAALHTVALVRSDADGT
jgi:hypothetical protein